MRNTPESIVMSISSFSFREYRRRAVFKVMIYHSFPETTINNKHSTLIRKPKAEFWQTESIQSQLLFQRMYVEEKQCLRFMVFNSSPAETKPNNKHSTLIEKPNKSCNALAIVSIPSLCFKKHRGGAALQGCDLPPSPLRQVGFSTNRLLTRFRPATGPFPPRDLRAFVGP